MSKLKNDKFQNQKDYKAFLDYQTYSKSTPGKQLNTNQLIMPSYHYPNRAQALNKKAQDSIELVKKNNLFDKQNKYFSSNAQYETIIDYGNN